MDGGFYIDMIDVLVKTYGKGLPTDGQKAQSFQSIARAGWPRFSLAVLTWSADAVAPVHTDTADKAAERR
jgi:hypothetical protein